MERQWITRFLNASLQTLMTMMMMIMIFWVLVPCGLVDNTSVSEKHTFSIFRALVLIYFKYKLIITEQIALQMALKLWYTEERMSKVRSTENPPSLPPKYSVLP